MVTHEDNAASMSEGEEDKENSSNNRPKSPSNLFKQQHSAKIRAKGAKASISWPEKPIGQKGKEKTFYGAVTIDGERYEIGDGVLYRYADDSATYLRRIEHLYEWEDGQKFAHLQWFIKAGNTILMDAAEEREVFQEIHCEEALLCNVVGKAEINYWKIPDNWASLGGEEESIADQPPVNKANEHSYWYRMRYVWKHMPSNSIPKISK